MLLAAEEENVSDRSEDLIGETFRQKDGEKDRILNLVLNKTSQRQKESRQ